MNERCLQEHTGSCLGCNILNIVLERRRGVRAEEEKPLVEKVRKGLCPEGKIPLVPFRQLNCFW